ncbi:MAG: EscU/YscU/HrcU family type III secretion system export apparatus switch protein [Lachnospiraceae bacterium]|nr:EscU/YscU/HrcU family type III secretion system export apparatus switch protein [Lachnospiraceae bacterium]
MEYGYNKNSGRPGSEGGEKKRKAVALVYEPGSQAPQVIASGKGVVADKIIEKAKESDVPLYKDTNLADTLLNLDIGDCIPPELYGVVAEILVYVDKMDKIKAKLQM